MLEASTFSKSEATEISGTKLDDGVSRNSGDAKETLSIIEAGFYKAINNDLFIWQATAMARQ